MIRVLSKLTLIVLVAFFGSSQAIAADYDAEIMTLKGTAQVTRQGAAAKTDLKEGDLLKAGDRIEVGPASYVDVAYDKEWNNLTRLSENSVTTLEAIFPTGLKLDRGDVYAKLGKLPKATTFEVHTPTAVAAARGTEFLVSVDEGGATEVIGMENRVEVFNLDATGNLDRHVVLEEAQKTEVSGLNEPPSPPEKVSEADLKVVETMSQDVAQAAGEVEKEGREGQIQSIGSVEAMNVLSDVYLSPEHQTDGPPSDASAGAKPALRDDQVAALREQFVEMGGHPAEFDKFKDEFSQIDPQTFEQMHDRFESGEYQPNLPGSDGRLGDQEPGPGSAASEGPQTRAGEFEPQGLPEPGSSAPENFVPPNMESVERSMEQTVEQTIQQTEANLPPPPPPPDDPCLLDPAHCGSTGGN